MLPIIIEYEQTLMGNKVKIAPSFFKGSPEIAHDNALIVLRYVFTDLLGWEPEEVQRNVSRDILKKMKVDVIYDKYIVFPMELDKDEDIHYLAYLLFPTRIYYPTKDLALAVLKRVDEKGKKFPKFYFATEGGMERACFALLYMINGHMWNRTIEEYYDFFANETEARAFLKKHHLMTAFESHFGSTLDYFHYSLSTEQQDDFYYYYHKFNEYWATLTFNKEEIECNEKGKYVALENDDGIYSYHLIINGENVWIPEKDTELRMSFDDETPFLNDFDFNTNHKFVLYIPEDEYERICNLLP